MRRAVQRFTINSPRWQSSNASKTTVTRLRFNSTAAATIPAVQHKFPGYQIDPLDAPLRPKTLLPASGQRVQLSVPLRDEDGKPLSAPEPTESRLVDPVERKAAINAASTNIAGVLVPPKPEEPDNCCLGGCVNCVWDLYRSDMEEWAAKKAEAKKRLNAQPASMDDDGGPLAEHKALLLEDDGDEGKDLFENIPVGLKAFMEIEKMLKKQRLEREAVAAATAANGPAGGAAGK